MTICDDLRQSVLQAAIQGKLTTQLPEDGSASDLLKSIWNNSNSINGQRVKIKKISEVSEADLPFDVPDNWEWIRLGTVCVVARGGSPRPIKDYITDNPNGINWIKIGDTEKNGKYIEHTAEKIIEAGVAKSRMVHKGDFLLTNSMSFGRPYILRTDGCIHDGWLVISQPIKAYDEDFLYWLLSSNFAYSQFSEKVSGAVVKNLNSDKVANSLFPLPPLAEQHRIVARVDELMAKIDELETVEKELVALKKAFPGDMKASLLQAAMQGKLTQQLPEDGSAADLLASIRAEKEQLIKEKKIKKEKPLAPISEDEIPFDIPDNWEWVRLSYIGEIVGGGTPKTEVPSYWDGDIPWLTPADMKNVMSRYVKNGERFITEEGLANSSSRLMPKGTVLYSSRAPIGYIAISENDICTNQGFKSVVPYIHGLSEYLYYAIIQATPGIVKRASGTTFKEISGSEFGKTVIPLPPLAEQKRIVEKLDKLLPLCDALKEDGVA